MQIHIALCDDEMACHATIKKFLADYRQKTSSVSFTLSCFSSGKDLLAYIDENKAFDIYILDIIMPANIFCLRWRRVLPGKIF